MQKLTRDQILAVYDAGPDAVIYLIDQLFSLVAINEELSKQVTQLQARVNELEKQLAKNSRNSHKPPSSDGLKRQTKSLRKKSKRKAGGQKGHKGQTLKQIAKPDKIVKCSVTNCTGCGQSLQNTKYSSIEKRQVFDIPPITMQVTEYQAETKVCSHCQTTSKASFPGHVSKAVQYGPGIKSQAVYLMNQHLLPYKRTSEIIDDIYGHKPSQGTLFNFNKDFYKALEKPVFDIKEHIVNSSVVQFDESGLKVSKITKWLHSAGTKQWTYYTVHQKRGSDAMNDADILSRFKGTAVHDFWKPYFKFSCAHALCNAHHLRELIFLFEHEKQKWAKDMIDLLLQIKQTVEKARTKHLARNQMDQFEKQYQKIIYQGFAVNPDTDPKRRRKKKSKAQNLLYRLQNHREKVLAFMYDFQVPFDNNLAERDIRMLKVQQKISGCFRSDLGAEMFCRIRSYISTAKKQDYHILSALQMALNNINPFQFEMTAE